MYHTLQKQGNSEIEWNTCITWKVAIKVVVNFGDYVVSPTQLDLNMTDSQYMLAHCVPFLFFLVFTGGTRERSSGEHCRCCVCMINFILASGLRIALDLRCNWATDAWMSSPPCSPNNPSPNLYLLCSCLNYGWTKSVRGLTSIVCDKSNTDQR